MAFSINFLDKTALLNRVNDDFKEVLEPDDVEAAEITIGEFKEAFLSSVDYWSMNDYRKHWLGEIQKILNGECDKTALIADMYDPKQASHLNSWLIYREGETVYIHNQLLPIDNIAEHFDISRLPEYVHPRITHNEEGDKFSEWVVSISDLEQWLNELKSGEVAPQTEK